jgi:hypothetical protein
MQASATWIAKDVAEDRFVGVATSSYAIVVEYVD